MGAGLALGTGPEEGPCLPFLPPSLPFWNSLSPEVSRGSVGLLSPGLALTFLSLAPADS